MEQTRRLVTTGIYHIFSKSIAGYKIFNNDPEFKRVTAAFQYYQRGNPSKRFSRFIERTRNKEDKSYCNESFQEKEKLVEIIAYCLMPTHLHLVLKQLKDNGISLFMKNLLNSYTRYFNIKLKRKGPLWEGRFKDVLVDTDEQLIHLTRYLHLNPVTAYLVDRPEDWRFSSYSEYLGENSNEPDICKYDNLLDIRPDSYKEFTEDNISYQRSLVSIIKDIIIE